LNKYSNVKFIVDSRLNPGATVNDYHSIISENSKFEIICLVGHEPDISNFVSDYLTEGKLQIILKNLIHLNDKNNSPLYVGCFLFVFELILITYIKIVAILNC